MDAMHSTDVSISRLAMPYNWRIAMAYRCLPLLRFAPGLVGLLRRSYNLVQDSPLNRPLMVADLIAAGMTVDDHQPKPPKQVSTATRTSYRKLDAKDTARWLRH